MKLAWIPNVLTLGNLACGFVSVIFSSADSTEGYAVAAILILFAALLDGLDGQVARWLRVASPIGEQLDSLADSVAFGVAPGYLAYRAYLMGISVSVAGRPVEFGILMAMVFPICAAYRLARFNVHSSPDSFTGLPSPIAGIMVGLGILCFPARTIPRPLFAFLFCLVGFLMVSTVGYSKPQSFILKNLQGLRMALLIVLILLLLFLFRFWVILIPVAVYVLSGLLGWLIHFIEEHRY
ncbi:MAG: CDP-diacylglycerol--serine O-phosphatidyltransferase [Syntrophorhabdales bacterium]|jgi:CDP-diacylglycerol--serine O-phosphatidyltransferase